MPVHIGFDRIAPLIRINVRPRPSRINNKMSKSFRIPVSMRLTVRLAAVLLTLLLSCCFSAYTWAQAGGDAAAGQHLAEGWCSACHIIGPREMNGTSNGAPSFVAVARMKSTTPTALHVFLQTPHGRMPDFHLTRQEIADVSAYIMSLRKP